MRGWLLLMAVASAQAQGNASVKETIASSPAHLAGVGVNAQDSDSVKLGITLQVNDACTTVSGIDVHEAGDRLVVVPQIEMFASNCVPVDAVLRLFKALDASQAARFGQAFVRLGSEERQIALPTGVIAKDDLSPPQRKLR